MIYKDRYCPGSIVDTLPLFIKSAPVSHALAAAFQEVLIHTARHYD